MTHQLLNIINDMVTVHIRDSNYTIQTFYVNRHMPLVYLMRYYEENYYCSFPGAYLVFYLFDRQLNNSDTLQFLNVRCCVILEALWLVNMYILT